MIPYKNEPFSSFSEQEEQASFLRALSTVRTQCGRNYPLWIGGKTEYPETGWIESFNPAEPEARIGNVAKGTAEHAHRAVEAASEAYPKWKSTKVIERIRILWKAAELLRRRKHEFSSWLVLETGKTWAEADGETAEAIDFLNYYAHEAERLAACRPLTVYAGEDNEWKYEALGVGIIIAPWNFPLAILAGMAVAALVCGNTVVVKPSSLTPVVAAKWIELMHEAGLPPEVLQFVPGPGAEVGDALVDHPKTRFVSFTGSREVGQRIYSRASMVNLGQKWLKRSILELGGKDAIIVDADANIEAAVQAIVVSSFGFSGQKCSACSRAIVHQDVYHDVLHGVIAQTKRLRAGNPADFGVQIGTVIDGIAQRNLLRYIEEGKNEADIAYSGDILDANGYYVPPTIFNEVPLEGMLAQQELFGPILSFHRVEHFEAAIAAANDTVYGLTGAVFSRNRNHLAYAREHFHVGNLYFNRKCTGALVGVHPFGGFGLSGTDSKAGGPDYLLNFLQGKVISEAF